ncbi:MAG: hypothetical protein E7Z63_01005 [Thermoplasmata archaeon]|nr:hypothetical protein [Thermoplasmata archaeon]
MFGFMSTQEKGAALINMLISLFAPTIGFLVIVVMFIVGMIQGGNYTWARGTAFGFFFALVIDLALIILGISTLVALDVPIE